MTDHYILLREVNGDWVEIFGPNPRSGCYGDHHYTGIDQPEIVVEHDPVLGYHLHILTRANVFELEELHLALKHCSRFQPTVGPEEAWLYE
jgi:uncharacterized protein (DUF169 family)